MTDASQLPPSPDDPGSTAANTKSSEPAARAPSTSKAENVTKLLRRAKGATLAELQEATAWQPHSVRAFLSGLRKKGSVLNKEQRKSGETTYRLAGKSAPAAALDA